MKVVVRLIFLLVLAFIVGQSWASVVISLESSHRYDWSGVTEDAQNYDYGVVQKSSGGGVRQTIGFSSDNVQGEFFFAFVDSFFVAKGAKPANFSPPGSSRSGAFNEAKRQSGIPTSQHPSRVLPNVDKRGNPQPGRIYEYEVPAPGGKTKTVIIRDDAGGHDFGPGNSQNRGTHFNDEAGGHYDY